MHLSQILMIGFIPAIVYFPLDQRLSQDLNNAKMSGNEKYNYFPFPNTQLKSHKTVKTKTNIKWRRTFQAVPFTQVFYRKPGKVFLDG